MAEVHSTGKSHNFKDIRGQRFGRLLVVEYAGKYKRLAKWKCQCDCGAEYVAVGARLRSGNTKSCGCLSHDALIERNRTHGLASSDEYRIWQGMVMRCQNKENAVYGGRGITVCERWRTFENFYADMGPRPTKGHSLERVDNDKGYSPENVKWATRKEQNRNTRQNRMVTFRGRTQCLSAWAEEVGIPMLTIRARIFSYGWDAEKALTTPPKPWNRPRRTERAN